MHRWQVGDIEVVRVEAAAFSLPTHAPVPAWFVPAFAPNSHGIRLAFSAIAVRAGATRIVIDPWLADDSPRTRVDAASHAAGLLTSWRRRAFPPTRSTSW